ncbi:MAG: hypothetical protein BGN88_00135 [Clostridiales bacterium 43-6]|nr:MAG: hypothetical protein BGN88_00135 [Clostridiales bacterium 43-6]
MFKTSFPKNKAPGHRFRRTDTDQTLWIPGVFNCCYVLRNTPAFSLPLFGAQQKKPFSQQKQQARQKADVLNTVCFMGVSFYTYYQYMFTMYYMRSDTAMSILF